MFKKSYICLLFFHWAFYFLQKEGEGAQEDGGMTPAPGAGSGGGGDKKLTNQFNYSERASQTYNNPLRVSVDWADELIS